MSHDAKFDEVITAVLYLKNQHISDQIELDELAQNLAEECKSNFILNTTISRLEQENEELRFMYEEYKTIQNDRDDARLGYIKHLLDLTVKQKSQLDEALKTTVHPCEK